jgi:FAD:protein FMN transferase
MVSSKKRMRVLLGTYVEIGANIATTTDQAIEAAYQTIEVIQSLMSFHDPNSELSQLNHSQGKAIQLNPHTIKVLTLARDINSASQGLFNCTVGGALVKQGILPNHQQEDFLDYGQADDIELHADSARLKRNIRITLDGIAKGYAIDCAISTLKKHGVKAGWVNAGGDLRIFGDIALPIQQRDEIGHFHPLGVLQNCAIATSGVYPATSKSFPGWIVSEFQKPEIGIWSVLADKAWLADALTKVASLASSETRAALIKKLGGKLVCSQEALTKFA